MKEMTRKRLIRLGVFFLGTLPVAWRVPVGKAVWTKIIDRDSSRQEDGQAQFKQQDAVGVFRLGYVDCVPYSGPEQIIRIDEDGEIRCVEPDEAVPGVRETGNSTPAVPKQRIGKLTVGTLLKGELTPSPGFVSAAKAQDRIEKMSMQVVYLPGGPPGVWMALTASSEDHGRVTWDEIYVRHRFQSPVGVTA